MQIYHLCCSMCLIGLGIYHGLLHIKCFPNTYPEILPTFPSTPCLVENTFVTKHFTRLRLKGFRLPSMYLWRVSIGGHLFFITIWKSIHLYISFPTYWLWYPTDSVPQPLLFNRISSMLWHYNMVNNAWLPCASILHSFENWYWSSSCWSVKMTCCRPSGIPWVSAEQKS